MYNLRGMLSNQKTNDWQQFLTFRPSCHDVIRNCLLLLVVALFFLSDFCAEWRRDGKRNNATASGARSTLSAVLHSMYTTQHTIFISNKIEELAAHYSCRLFYQLHFLKYTRYPNLRRCSSRGTTWTIAKTFPYLGFRRSCVKGEFAYFMKCFLSLLRMKDSKFDLSSHAFLDLTSFRRRHISAASKWSLSIILPACLC